MNRPAALANGLEIFDSGFMKNPPGYEM